MTQLLCVYALELCTFHHMYHHFLKNGPGISTTTPQKISPMIPLSLLSRVEVGLCVGGPGLLLVGGPVTAQGAGVLTGLQRVPLGLVLELHCGEGKDKGWAEGRAPALVFRVEEGLSEHGDAVLQVNVELGLPPRAEVSHWKMREEKWWCMMNEVKTEVKIKIHKKLCPQTRWEKETYLHEQCYFRALIVRNDRKAPK